MLFGFDLGERVLAALPAWEWEGSWLAASTFLCHLRCSIYPVGSTPSGECSWRRANAVSMRDDIVIGGAGFETQMPRDFQQGFCWRCGSDSHLLPACPYPNYTGPVSFVSVGNQFMEKYHVPVQQ